MTFSCFYWKGLVSEITSIESYQDMSNLRIIHLKDDSEEVQGTSSDQAFLILSEVLIFISKI